MARFGEPQIRTKPRLKGVYRPGDFSVNRKLGNKLKLGFKSNMIGRGLGKIKL